jgi:outer membrane receptor protein involved in Fe transport
VITEREIRESRPNQLANALVLVPGSGSLEEGHSVVPTLRGMARGRTLILLDGGRVTAERRAGPSATYLDPMTLDSVEVSRGPGSVAYGSDAFGGVINVTTKSPSVSGFAGQFSAAGRTVDDSVTGNLALDVPIGSSGLLFQGHWRNFDDYDSPEGVIENSAAEFYGWSARGLVPLGAAGLTLGFDYDRGRDIGKPATDSHVTRAFYPLENSSRASFDLDLPATFGFDEIGIQGFWGTYRLVTDRERQPTATVTKRLARSDVDADDASLRAVGTRALGAGRLRTGIDFNTRFDLHADGLTVNYDAQGNPTGEVPETSIENAQRFDVGGFLEADQPLLDGKVLAAGGLRGDWVQSQNFGGYFGTQSVTHGALSGYAAATYSPKPSWSATFQYAHGFRDPTLSDRYFRGCPAAGS